MPQAGVSMSRGRVHHEQVGREPAAEERFDDRPYTGPLPVRAGAADGDLELAQRAVAASPRPTRSARPAPMSDDRESLRNARAAIASWEQTDRAPIDSWDVPARTRRRGTQESPRRPAAGSAVEARPRVAADSAVEARPEGSLRTRAQARRPEDGAPGSEAVADMPGMVRAARPTPLPRSAMTTAVSTPRQAGGGIPGRRTVQIQGRGAERYNAGFERRRPPRRPHEREGFRPDRAAMWAVLLGFVLVLVAATSSHAAVLAHHIH